MFIEPGIIGEKRGWIEAICGSMFSGKTEELIRRLKRAKIANLSVEIFKPSFDKRYDDSAVVSHDANKIHSTAVDNSREILRLVENVHVVGIDEAHFFDEGIVQVCEQLAMRGIRVIIAGLDMDYLGRPFRPVADLLAIADFITKLHAICVVCGNIAAISYRKTKDTETFLLGEKDVYEPKCKRCAALGEAGER
jgi:thymidine kinase